MYIIYQLEFLRFDYFCDFMKENKIKIKSFNQFDLIL